MIIIPLLAMLIVTTIIVISAAVTFIVSRRSLKNLKANSYRPSNRGKKVTTFEVFDNDGIGFVSAILSGVAVIMALFLVVALIPFNPKFWTYAERTGTIEVIEMQTVQSGGSKSVTIIGEYAIILDGQDDIILSQDSRLQTYKAGDSIKMRCTWEWIAEGSDKLNCTLKD